MCLPLLLLKCLFKKTTNIKYQWALLFKKTKPGRPYTSETFFSPEVSACNIITVIPSERQIWIWNEDMDIFPKNSMIFHDLVLRMIKNFIHFRGWASKVIMYPGLCFH